MPFINYYEKEIAFKIVYYGPGLSGKTTNLLCIYRNLASEVKGELFTLNTAEERTLFFDFFPVDLGRIEGYAVRFHLYTVPGQVYYEASRKLILEGTDGVVFVADSQPARLDDNLQSFRMMQDNLAGYGLGLTDGFPAVLQYNKRDCSGPIRVGTIEERLELPSLPWFEAVATQGRGVMETVNALSKAIIMKFQG